MDRCQQDPLIPEVHVLFGHPGGPAAAVRGGAADAAILRAPFDPRGLDAGLLITEPRVAVLPAGHRLAGRAELERADLAGEPMPRWAGQADPAAAQCRSAGLAVVPVGDLSPSQVMVAWPDTSRSAAVAAFVRAALEAAETQAETQAAQAEAEAAHAAHTPGAL